MNLFLQCGLLLTVSRAVGAVTIDASHQLRRSSEKAPSAVKNTLVAMVDERQPIIQKVVDVHNSKVMKPKEQRLMDAISKFRAEICADMKDEHGKKFKSYEACKDFMKTTCNPGKDKAMDGDGKEVTSQEGFCQEYFPNVVKKAEAQIEKEDKDAAAPAPAPSTAPGPAPAPAPSPAPAPAPAVAAPAPAPVEAPGPAPGPVPAPFVPGVTAGKPHGEIVDDHAYYFKNGGKDPSRMHMNADLALPDQGYWGKLIEHEDQKTSTEDWGHEFGPTSGHESIEAVCREHPDSSWCQEHFQRHKSSCPAMPMHLLPLVCAFVAIGMF